MRLFDSHCHIQDDRILAKADDVIARARSAGVRHMLCCGSSESDWDAVGLLAARYPEIVPAFGVHPWYVKTRSAAWLEDLESRLAEFPAAAVGEIGLDHALDERNDGDQASVLVSQLKLARKLERPVSIHCRKAWAAMLQVLGEQGLPQGGVIHAYSGAPDLVPRFERTGASISFSGSITYDRNRRSHASAIAVSEDRLLIETDAPDIPPAGVAEGANEPANIVKVAEKIAALRGKTVEEIGEMTYGNACRIFRKTEWSSAKGTL